MSASTCVDVTVDGVEYTATVDHHTGNVAIDRDGVWAGTGRWTGHEIVDCAADLGGDVYEALDEALADAIDAAHEASRG